MALDIEHIRRQFPILQRQVAGKPIAYLDDAATSQKPRAVLDAMMRFYEDENANVHRGMHPLADSATMAYENARASVRHFLNAAHDDEIIFTKSSTESINLVARSYGDTFLQSGDAVLLTILEHHSNIVPWLQLKERKAIDVRWIEIDASGELDMQSLHAQLADGHVKLLSITGLSNVLGVLPPLRHMIKEAHAHGAVVLVDASQLAAHSPIDVADLDCDFLTLSGHKVYGPTGIGVLYAKRELLKKMPPFLGGGSMVTDVSRTAFTAAESPMKFEAGTPPIAEAVGLAAAIEWQKQFNWQDRVAREKLLLKIALNELRSIEGLRILGPADPDTILGSISFVIDGIHPHDLTEMIGQEGLCLRAGHHCAMPLHTALGIASSTRLSISLHTTEDEIRLVAPAIREAISILKK